VLGKFASEAEADSFADALMKGDVPGHEFHGNQYQEVGGSGPDLLRAATSSGEAIRLSAKASDSAGHERASLAHEKAYRDSKLAAESARARGQTAAATAHESNAKYHEKQGDLHQSKV
jgi:hypothetical protein